ncbi:amidase [Pigmentiphaga aceris]|uniref:Amidase n=1 Tax=Pigmentiphaga aceris TaxID=1940612 RepID=A0A5C0AS49_9BURK|nr:amidase [Pigmentiphaga aceris]QEI04476.1 amidase [Pigmentiphaga aceris]
MTTSSREDARETIAVLLRHAGLLLSPSQLDEIQVGWTWVAPMLERIRAQDPRDTLHDARAAPTHRLLAEAETGAEAGPQAGQPTPHISTSGTPTIAEAAALIRARRLSPVELVEHCLARIAAHDGALHSFITVTAERARRDAHAAEQRMMTGTLRGKLDGIPIAHKDIYCTRGIATTAHSRLLQDWVPDEDAHLVTRLADAGTTLLGKLATHEFALGGPPFDLPWPPARNPWHTDHYASGSSSGTAVALAAGLILGGTGTDTAGSIRAPAAFCGIVGLKPTYGLCSTRGILPLARSLDHAGPMAQTVEDCALLLQVMAGHDAADSTSANRSVPDFSAGLGKPIRGVRIGVASRWHEIDHPVSPAVQAGIDTALRILRDLGAEIVELALPPLADFQAAGFVIMASEAFAVHEATLQTRLNDYGHLLRNRLVLGALMCSADYVQARHRRDALCARMAQSASNVDIVITAGAPREAPRFDAVVPWGDLSHPSFTTPFNLTGWPALCMPAGYGMGGMPVGVQLAAKPFQEALLLQVADALERAGGFGGRHPTLA